MANGRYSIDDNIKKDKSGKTVYKSVLYPEIPISEDDIYIIIKQTDRLDLLAYKYYSDVTKWWIIAHANHIKNTFYIKAETQVRIPMNIDKILSDMENLNKDVQ